MDLGPERKLAPDGGMIKHLAAVSIVLQCHCLQDIHRLGGNDTWHGQTMFWQFKSGSCFTRSSDVAIVLGGEPWIEGDADVPCLDGGHKSRTS